MIPYADTNFFTNLIAGLPKEMEARQLAHAIKRRLGVALPITWLIRMEVINALQQCVFLSRQGTQQLRVTAEMATVMEACFWDEMDEGTLFRPTALNHDSLEKVFRQLSYRHTAKGGFRTYDILHVASALVLNCDTFWSFDTKARKLAALEGLNVN